MSIHNIYLNSIIQNAIINPDKIYWNKLYNRYYPRDIRIFLNVTASFCSSCIRNGTHRIRGSRSAWSILNIVQSMIAATRSHSAILCGTMKINRIQRPGGRWSLATPPAIGQDIVPQRRLRIPFQVRTLFLYVRDTTRFINYGFEAKRNIIIKEARQIWNLIRGNTSSV